MILVAVIQSWLVEQGPDFDSVVKIPIVKINNKMLIKLKMKVGAEGGFKLAYFTPYLY